MNRLIRIASVAAALMTCQLSTGQAVAQQCGGDFNAFLAGVKKEAVSQGISARGADQALAGARIDR